jgi:hypothetical protein
MKIFSIWIRQQSTNLCFNGVAKKFQKEDIFMELEWKWLTEPEMKCQLIGNGMAAKW